jgi:hypothetical protein
MPSPGKGSEKDMNITKHPPRYRLGGCRYCIDKIKTLKQQIGIRNGAQ